MKLAERDRLAASSDQVKSTIDIVWSAYRSVLPPSGKLAYASTAITTGRRFYDLLAETGLSSMDELKARHPEMLFDRIIRPNVDAGTAAARAIAARAGHAVVAPAIFEARRQRWSQDEYMAMWLRMIEENVGTIYLLDGWEFSNGGAEEFLHAMQMAAGFRSRWDIVAQDAAGKPIPLAEGTWQVGKALVLLHDRGYKAPILADAFCALLAVWGIWHSAEMSSELPPKGAYNAEIVWGDGRDLTRFARELAPLLKQDYGIIHPYTTINSVDGIPRKNDATPEGIVLREEAPGDAP